MIVVTGEALIDLIIDVDRGVSAELGGGPFNVARTIGRLGLDVAFLGSVSNDRFGTRLFDQLQHDGVRTDLISRTGSPTTLAAAELDAQGTATYRFYIHGTAAPELVTITPIDAHVEAVHVGTLGLVLEPMASTIVDHLATLAGDVIVMVDPNCRDRVIDDRDAYLARLDLVLERAHIVKVSADDARYIAPRSSPIDVAHSMVARGVRVVLVTDGGRETHVVTHHGHRSVDIPRITVVDTIGAGDSFGGGFLAAWCTAQRPIDDLSDLTCVVAATRAANEVAASTCTRAGADPPWRAQLRPEWPGT